MFNISWVATDALTPNRRNARTHSRKQIGQIAESIRAFGFVVPILVDEKGVIIAGHERHSAAQLLKLEQVPTIKVQDCRSETAGAGPCRQPHRRAPVGIGDPGSRAAGTFRAAVWWLDISSRVLSG